jgi:UDP:flavonoid glycosyltransferase YjiC (YdhE family)
LKRIFYATELGGGLGHVNAFLPLARALEARGCMVTWAISNPVPGGVLPPDIEAAVLRAPLFDKQVIGLPHDQLAFSEILMRQGYLEPQALADLLRGWRALMQQAAFDLVITDHAPTALLAARTLGLPRARIGTGFCCPPAIDPEPPLQPWRPAVPERRAEAAQTVLSCINSALHELDCAPLASLGAMHEADGDLLATFAELDHYARPQGAYFGPLLGPDEGALPAWPAGRHPRVFVYLKGQDPASVTVLRALRRKHYACIVYCPDLPAPLRMELESPLLQFSGRPLAMHALMPDCDLVVCSGGHGTLCRALLAGKPVLVVPPLTEQAINGRMVSELGAGLMLAPGQHSRVGALLTRLFSESGFRQAAQLFAARHSSYSHGAAVDALAGRCLQLAAKLWT